MGLQQWFRNETFDLKSVGIKLSNASSVYSARPPPLLQMEDCKILTLLHLQPQSFQLLTPPCKKNTLASASIARCVESDGFAARHATKNQKQAIKFFPTDLLDVIPK